MLTKLPDTVVQTDAFACEGGWDIQTPPLSMPAGRVRDALNFMAGINGGYQRIPGYERYDGHASPSNALYYFLPMTFSGTASIGDTIAGETSGDTAKVIAVSASGVYFAAQSGLFDAGETISVGGSPIGAATVPGYAGAAESRRQDAELTAAAADLARASISAVPGSGPIRGVWEYKGVVYAFRNAADGLSCKMYKATASGWSLVTTPTLAPGGTYEFVNYNFGGATGTYCMYGASGVHKAFQFDGTTLTLITTGMTTDTPKHITAHKNHLFLSFDASVQHSPITNPTGTWTPVFGAEEIAIGATVTGFLPMIGNENTAALMISTRNKIHILYGNSSADWQRTEMMGDVGAKDYTTQKIGDVLMLDDRGIATLSTSSNYGNFVGGTITENILDWMREHRNRAVASCVSRENNQYRLFFSDKYALYVTLRSGKSPQVMPILFKHAVTCVCSTEMSDGTEAIFFGSDDGFVYQMDKGSSFDGQSIPYNLTFAFNHSKSSRVNKRYRKLILELTGSYYTEFSASYQLGYSDSRISQPGQTALNGAGLSAPLWDSFVWDNFFWDGRTILPSELAMSGTADNFSLLITGDSALFYPFTLSSVLVNYTPRRRIR